MRLESEYEEALCNEVAVAGGRAEKLVFQGKRGFLDRTLFFPERRIGFLEMKRPGKSKTYHHQTETVEWLLEFGFPALITSDLDEALAFVERVRRGR